MIDIPSGFTIKGSVAALAALLLNACVPVDGADNEQWILKGKATTIGTEVDFPAGTETYADGSYAIPHSVDGEGCEIFAIWVPSGLSQRTLYFRNEETLFSTSRSPALCNVVMKKNGTDADGCTTFRAIRKSGETSDAIYYRQTPDLYTASKERGCP